MNELFESQRSFYHTNQTKPYAFRLRQLKRLKQLILEQEEAIIDALHQDLHKSRFESYATEIGFCLKSINLAIKRLKRWMKPKRVGTPLFQLNTRSYIVKEPLGTVLIIGPYNYPFQLVIEPLIGAIAAGNTVIVKPSEQTLATETLLLHLINNHFEPNYLRVVTGNHERTQELIHLPFDHIFFTGSTHVGQIVYEAASKNLVPVTLELGGKSPTIVDATADLRIAARRVAFGKFINAGQTCIAPDYIYVHDSVHDEFVKHLNDTMNKFARNQEEYGRIVNAKHFDRLVSLIEKDKVVGNVIHDTTKRLIAPSVMIDVTWDDSVMKEEIFGPILPILRYASLDEVVQQIRSGAKPLALYLFSKDKQTQQRIWNELSFGGGAINDTVMHFSNHHLPFGGIGSSGIGSYHGKHTFELFSHHKSTIKRSFLWDPPLAYPPYNNAKESLIRRVLK